MSVFIVLLVFMKKSDKESFCSKCLLINKIPHICSDITTLWLTLLPMNETVISPFISNKFRFWSFISMVLLVFVHGYNLHIRYLQPWTIPNEPMTFTGFTEYLLSNGILRFRIPMLFIISGFLYAMHDQRSYKQRTGKRFRTLFLPYLIWSAIGILFTYLLESFPTGRELVQGSHIVQIDDTRQLLHDYKWYELVFVGFFCRFLTSFGLSAYCLFTI